MSRDLSIGTIKKPLINQTGVALTGSAGTALGAFNAQRFSSIGGLVSCVGSLTLQIQFASNSGSWLVSSAVTVNSGASVFSFTNYGKIVNLNVSQAASQSLNTIFAYGQP